jgi:outer membrane protein assembly factor BamA
MRPPSSISLRAGFLAGAILIASVAVLPQSSSTSKTYTLAGVTVSGAKRFTQEQLVASSGLKKGQQIDIPGIDTAADRLFKTGALANISYAPHCGNHD